MSEQRIRKTVHLVDVHKFDVHGIDVPRVPGRVPGFTRIPPGPHHDTPFGFRGRSEGLKV